MKYIKLPSRLVGFNNQTTEIVLKSSDLLMLIPQRLDEHSYSFSEYIIRGTKIFKVRDADENK